MVFEKADRPPTSDLVILKNLYDKLKNKEIIIDGEELIYLSAQIATTTNGSTNPISQESSDPDFYVDTSGDLPNNNTNSNKQEKSIPPNTQPISSTKQNINTTRNEAPNPKKHKAVNDSLGQNSIPSSRTVLNNLPNSQPVIQRHPQIPIAPTSHINEAQINTLKNQAYSQFIPSINFQYHDRDSDNRLPSTVYRQPHSQPDQYGKHIRQHTRPDTHNQDNMIIHKPGTNPPHSQSGSTFNGARQENSVSVPKDSAKPSSITSSNNIQNNQLEQGESDMDMESDGELGEIRQDVVRPPVINNLSKKTSTTSVPPLRSSNTAPVQPTQPIHKPNIPPQNSADRPTLRSAQQPPISNTGQNSSQVDLIPILHSLPTANQPIVAYSSSISTFQELFNSAPQVPTIPTLVNQNGQLRTLLIPIIDLDRLRHSQPNDGQEQSESQESNH